MEYLDYIADFFRDQKALREAVLNDNRDCLFEIADGLTDVYSSDLAKWAGTHEGMIAISEYADEFGGDALADGIKERGMDGIYAPAQCVMYESLLQEAWTALTKCYVCDLDTDETSIFDDDPVYLFRCSDCLKN